MIRFFVVSFVLLTFIPISNKAQYLLNVEITNLRNNNGPILMELYSENHVLLKQEKGIIKNNKCNFSFVNLKPAKYAIRYFHDENQDYKLDTNLIGVPTEGYGFSNNVLDTFGPPPFEKWIFEIKENTNITLKVKYH